MSAPTPETYRLLGGPGSPYSLKMRAILRYRRIPHHWIVPRGYIGSGGELQQAGKRIIPVMQYPDGGYRADSTPMAYDLESRHPGQRSIIPPDPGQAFLSHLIEDMADELLVIAMFDMRWDAAQDQAFCARRQMSGWLSPLEQHDLQQRIDQFILRQTANRAAMVQGNNHEILMELYTRVLALIEQMLETSAFLFGSRPALADFGLYAQLCQCAIDPTASGIMRSTAARTYQWTQTMDDCSGVDGEWAEPGADNPAVAGMLQLAGDFYLPFLHAHAKAAAEKVEAFSARVGGHIWQGGPESYKLRCLVWLRRELMAMPDAARSGLRPLLVRHGCWELLQPDALDQLPIPAMAPM